MKVVHIFKVEWLQCKWSVLVAPSLPVAVLLPPRRWLLVRQSSVGCVGRQTCCSAALSTPHHPRTSHRVVTTTAVADWWADLWKISNPTPANVQQYGDRDQTPIVQWQFQWPSISSPRLPIKAEIQTNLTVCWMVESEARDCDDGASVAPTAHHYSGHQRSVTSMFEHQVFDYTTQG